MKKTAIICVGVMLLSAFIIYFVPTPFLSPLAQVLIADDPPEHVDAVVVLNTGLGIYERLMEAADLYEKGYADKVVINGNRKNAVLKKLEGMGLEFRCSWDDDHIQILELLGVPREAIVSISAEDAYDTVSEARAVGNVLQSQSMKKLIITTSKTHTALAIHIWRNIYRHRFHLISVAAKSDPFAPAKWWTSGKYARQLLYEYGSWLYFYVGSGTIV